MAPPNSPAIIPKKRRVLRVVVRVLLLLFCIVFTYFAYAMSRLVVSAIKDSFALGHFMHDAVTLEGFKAYTDEFHVTVLEVNTTLTNTVWHSRISIGTTNDFSHTKNSDGVDSTLRVPMTISEVQTNWPNSFQRGAWIPLAALGDYKIMVTVK